MENTLILLIGFTALLSVFVLAEVAAKKFGWE